MAHLGVLPGPHHLLFVTYRVIVFTKDRRLIVEAVVCALLGQGSFIEVIQSHDVGDIFVFCSSTQQVSMLWNYSVVRVSPERSGGWALAAPEKSP